MACPHVAGIAALIKAKYPDKKASWIKNKIINSVDSRGIIDAYKAVINDTNDYYFSAGFPAGTKIIMNNGIEENIENLKIGQKVLSYDVKSDEYNSWRIMIVVKTMNSLITINNGFIQATVDHPLYIKKPDGSEGWGAYDTTDIEKAIICEGNFLKLEVGDQLLSDEGNWIEIGNIKSNPNLVKTYNIISFSGKRTYFANDVLVYEKHSPNIITNYLLYIFKQRFTILEQFIKSMPFFQPISQFLP